MLSSEDLSPQQINFTMIRKIGCVISYRDGHNNYGASLQAYAQLKKMQEWGFACEIIHYVKKLSLWQKARYLVNAVRAGETKWMFRCLRNRFLLKILPDYAANVEKRTNAVNAYKKQYLIPLFHEYVGYEALRKGNRNYAAVVVGSDQLWTPLSLPNRFFNLLFVDDDIPKIAYASSFGVSEIPAFQREATGAYLKRFKSIGVRETRGKEIVEALSGKTATVVLDPVLLMSREEWRAEIAMSAINMRRPYIFCYLLGGNPEARRMALNLKAKTGYPIVAIRHMDEYVGEDEHFGDEAPYAIGPNDFVKYISGAHYVCTDSFHCLAFSILFHKRFMVFYRYARTDRTGRNSRIDSLLHLLGIGAEHVWQGNNLADIDIPVDYRRVDAVLEELRNGSVTFLKSALEDATAHSN